jgi:hypothetical protein
MTEAAVHDRRCGSGGGHNLATAPNAEAISAPGLKYKGKLLIVAAPHDNIEMPPLLLLMGGHPVAAGTATTRRIPRKRSPSAQSPACARASRSSHSKSE